MIDNEILISLLEQHKLTDEQSEELQKGIYRLADGGLHESGGIRIAFDDEGEAHILNEDYCIYCANEEVFNTFKDAASRILHAKKPVGRSGPFGDISLRCPDCQMPVINYWCQGSKPEHCQFCGQKLDWSDKE